MSLPPHAFPPELAVKYGVDEALMIVHFQFWINFNKGNGKNFRDGRTWTYQSREAIAAHFPYWTPKQVRRITDSLVKKEVLIKGNYNKASMDKTTWFAFKDEEMFTMAQTGQSMAQTGQAIPESKPESKPFLRKDNVYEETPPPQKPPKADAEKTMPFAHAKGRDTGKKTKYPLKAEQKDIYELLVACDLGADHDCLCSLIRSHRSDDLVLALSEFNAQRDRGVRLTKTPIAFFRYILKKVINPIQRNSLLNRKWLREYAAAYDIPVDLQSTAAVFQNGKELPYSLNHESFKTDVKRIMGEINNVL